MPAICLDSEDSLLALDLAMQAVGRYRRRNNYPCAPRSSRCRDEYNYCRNPSDTHHSGPPRGMTPVPTEPATQAASLLEPTVHHVFLSRLSTTTTFSLYTPAHSPGRVRRPVPVLRAVKAAEGATVECHPLKGPIALKYSIRTTYEGHGGTHREPWSADYCGPYQIWQTRDSFAAYTEGCRRKLH